MDEQEAKESYFLSLGFYGGQFIDLISTNHQCTRNGIRETILNEHNSLLQLFGLPVPRLTRALSDIYSLKDLPASQTIRSHSNSRNSQFSSSSSSDYSSFPRLLSNYSGMKHSFSDSGDYEYGSARSGRRGRNRGGNCGFNRRNKW